MTEHPRYIGYLPDFPEGFDQLGFTAEVQAVAELLASRSLAPPFSFGVFGAAGSGKSSFGGLLHRRLEEISTRGEGFPALERSFVSPIVQIEVNAWHSSGRPPWSILAETVLQTIDDSLDAAARPEADALFRRLPTAERLQRALDDELTVAYAVRDTSLRERESLGDAYSTVNRQHARVEATPAWPRIHEQFTDHIGQEAARAVDRDGNRLGLPNLSQDAERLHRLLAETKTLGGTAGIFTSMNIARRYLGSPILVVLVVLVVALIAGLGYLVAESVGTPKDQLTTFFAGAAALAGAVGVLYTILMHNQASRALRRLRQHESALNLIVIEHEAEHARELHQLGEQLVQLRAAVAASDARVATANRTVAVAESRNTDFKGRPVLQSLVAEYFSSGSHLPQQAAEASIRRDFVALSTLIGVESFKSLEPGVEEAELSASGRLPERVVVFVESLDRCEPREGVEYLRAIQQLLALPAFVVVVLADPKRLDQTLAHWGVTDTVAGDNEISPGGAEYLSKLLQLHLWVEMTSEQSAQLAAGALSDSVNDTIEREVISRIARLLSTPREVKRLLNVCSFAHLLFDSRFTTERLPLPLLSQLGILLCIPSHTRLYSAVLDGLERDQSVDHLIEALDRSGLRSDVVSEILRDYEAQRHRQLGAKDADVGALKDWLPAAMRLSL